MTSSAEDTFSEVSSYSQSPLMRVNIQKAVKKPVVGLNLSQKGSENFINKSKNIPNYLKPIPYKPTGSKIVSTVQKVSKPNDRVANALQMLNKLDKRYAKPIVQPSKNLTSDSDSISLSSSNSSIGNTVVKPRVKETPPNAVKQIITDVKPTVSKKENIRENSIGIKKSTNTLDKSKPDINTTETKSDFKSIQQALEINRIQFDKSKNVSENSDLQSADVVEEIEYESDFESSDSDGSAVQLQELYNAREKMISSSSSSIHTEIDNTSQISVGLLKQENLELVIPYKNNYDSDTESTDSFEQGDSGGKRIIKSSKTKLSLISDSETEKAESVSSNYESDDSQPFQLNILTFEEFQKNQNNKRATVSPLQDISSNLKNEAETNSIQNIDSKLPQRNQTPDHSSRSADEVEELLGTVSSEELLQSLSERTKLKNDANSSYIVPDLEDELLTSCLSKDNKIAKTNLTGRDCVIEEKQSSKVIKEKETEQESKSTSTKSESSNSRKHRKKLAKHKHKNSQNIGVQTEVNDLPRERRYYPDYEWQNKSKRIPQPRLEHLKLSWDLDSSPRWDRLTDPNEIFLDLPPEVIEAFAIQKPSADCMNRIMKQHIRLTRNFMAAQYQMYVNYSKTVRSMCETYEPVTLEETKKFIAAHRESRTKT